MHDATDHPLMADPAATKGTTDRLCRAQLLSSSRTTTAQLAATAIAPLVETVGRQFVESAVAQSIMTARLAGKPGNTGVILGYLPPSSPAGAFMVEAASKRSSSAAATRVRRPSLVRRSSPLRARR